MPKTALANSKLRTLLVLGGIIAVVVVVIIMVMSRKPDPLETQQTQSSKVPQITAIPGSATSEKYQELQEEDNRKRAEEAKATGGSAVATIIGSRDKDALDKKETLGIEDLGKCPDCNCSGGPNRVLCPANPELALQQAGKNAEAVKKLLKDCPTMAKILMEKDPDMLKKIMLEDPALAKRIAEAEPATIKKIMTEDLEFAQKLSRTSPEATKALLDDPDFVNEMAEKNPEMLKELMKSDPALAAKVASSNPAIMKKFLLEDPDFAKSIAKNNPAVLKKMLTGDPEFAQQFGEKNPSILKELMKNDPSFAATITAQNPDLVKKLIADDPEFGKALARSNPLYRNQQRALSQEEMMQKRKEEQALKARQQQLNEQQQKQISTLLAGMESASKDYYKTWDTVSAQQFVAGSANEEKAANASEQDQAGGTTIPAGSSENKKTLVKAGTILFAVLDTAVNTDEPGPVLGTIVHGQYKGAKIIGEVQTQTTAGSTRPEKVTLNFTTLSAPDADKSISIKAVAVDPDTARTALASDVDHHYLLRYGTLLGSSFLSGYAKVISSQGTVQTDSGSGSSTTTTPPLNGREQIFAALGEVGKRVSEATSTYFSTPNTITVDAGTGFGLLMLEDLTES